MTRKPVLRSILPLAFAVVLLLPPSATATPHQPLLFPATEEPHQDGPSGLWSGSIEVGGQTLEIRVVLQATTDGGWTGLIDIPAQSLTGYPLTEISVSGGSVSFAMVGIPGNPVFTGSWEAENQTIAGDFEQGGRAFPFNLTRNADTPEVTAEAVSPEDAANVAGTWNGTMEAGPQTLRIVFHIVAGADGALTATMDSPDQGQTGMPINGVTFDGSVLRLTLDYAGASFEGTMTADGSAIDGNWSQGGASLPLRMTKQ